jgi:DNA gyrase subunit A
VYQIKVHELPDASRLAKGIPIVNVIAMQPDETVTTLLKVRDYNTANFLFFTTRLGRVKRVALEQFRTVRSNGIIAMGLDPADELLGANDVGRRSCCAGQHARDGDTLQ